MFRTKRYSALMQELTNAHLHDLDHSSFSFHQSSSFLLHLVYFPQMDVPFCQPIYGNVQPLGDNSDKQTLELTNATLEKARVKSKQLVAISIAALSSGKVGAPPWTSLEAGITRTNINSANKTRKMRDQHVYTKVSLYS